MKLKLMLLLALAIVFSATGCHYFKRSKKPKDNPAIAADVEADFRRRWIERRAAELSAHGTDATAAATQAEADFREQFPYLQKPRK